VIADFLSSWALFHNTYIAGWLIGVMLSLVGVLVVARDQIFLGAAVSQASMLGIALGMLAASFPALKDCTWCQSDAFLSFMGGGFAVLGAFVARGQSGPKMESREAVTGWVFLGSASLSIVLMAYSPHGMEEMHRLLSSTIIGATRFDVLVFLVMAVGTAIACGLALPRLMLLVMDPDMAGAVGMRVGVWESVLSAWLGLTVGVSLRVSGMIYTFGCLVLPALVAKSLCREVRSVFLLAPVIAVACGVVAFVLANHFDLPPGQVAGALLSGLLCVAWGVRTLRA
jgi:zinc transport system permease protein